MISSTTPTDTTDWTSYLTQRQQRIAPPRSTLLTALTKAVPTGTQPVALDLGCGSGDETLLLLNEGWNVIALDNQPAALKHLIERVPTGLLANLTTLHHSFEELTSAALPPCDLVNASYCLPFCAPEHFEACWQKITDTVKPQGRFAGHFFGERDEWFGRRNMSFHTLEQLEFLFRDFTVEWYEDNEFDALPSAGPLKQWHVISVVARRCPPTA